MRRRAVTAKCEDCGYTVAHYHDCVDTPVETEKKTEKKAEPRWSDWPRGVNHR